MSSVTLRTLAMKDTQSKVILSRISDDLIQVEFDEDFAGRPVQEEFSLEAITQIGGNDPYQCFDVLGMSFQTDGNEIKGYVGAGSGNVTFMILKDEWNEAVRAL